MTDRPSGEDAVEVVVELVDPDQAPAAERWCEVNGVHALRMVVGLLVTGPREGVEAALLQSVPRVSVPTPLAIPTELDGIARAVIAYPPAHPHP